METEEKEVIALKKRAKLREKFELAMDMCDNDCPDLEDFDKVMDKFISSFIPL